jgi:hypothetical protein
MKLSDLNSGKYLAGTDVGEVGAVFTIKAFDLEEMKDGSSKLVMHFREAGSKPMVVNKINGKRLTAIFRSDETDTMIGRKVHAYLDPMVEFQGKIVGGLRLKPPVMTAPQGGSKAPEGPRKDQVPPIVHDEANPPPFDDEVPF